MFLLKLWAADETTSRGRKKIPTEMQFDTDDVAVALQKAADTAKGSDDKGRKGIVRVQLERVVESGAEAANPFAPKPKEEKK